jgi:hypothetical protein
MSRSAHAKSGHVLRLLALMAVAAIVLPGATPAADAPRVCVARAERILMPEHVLAPEFIYPQGKIDYPVVAGLLDQAMMSLTGERSGKEAWCSRVTPLDRVGIMLDIEPLPVHRAILEAVTLRLIACGVPRENIIVFAAEETALFRAGFDLSEVPGRVRVMGADSEGYRRGMTRVVLDYCTVIINLSRLRLDARIGMSGAIANHLAAAPTVERLRLLSHPEELAAVAARGSLKLKTRLHIMDALRPGDLPTDHAEPETWMYRGVVVSEDPVALDAVARQILLARLRESKPDADALTPPVVYLEPAATRYRLGVADIDAIDLTELGP